MAKPRVYLAGPISGCNAEQRHAWRNDLKKGFSDEFEFVDPTDKLVGDDGSDFEVVQADTSDIVNADAILANMWRESIGTSFGILQGHLSGKIVVVSDPNLIRSRMVAFYADSVVRNLPAGLNAIRMFLKSQSSILAVEKKGGGQEPFDRRKLGSSIRKACIAARQADIVPSRSIVARTLSILLDKQDVERVISTQDVKDAVWEAMAELAADPLHEADYDAIRNAWEAYESGTVGARIAAGEETLEVRIHERPADIRAHTLGTHATIWGTKGQIGPEARKVFDEIRRVDGITEIVFGLFNNTGSPPSKPHVRIQASKTPHIIDGKCFDKGPKGTLQTFQIRVANPKYRDRILSAMRAHLVQTGHIRSEVFSAD